MTLNAPKDPSQGNSVILQPNPRLPIFISLLGILLFPLPFSPWPSIIITVFGLFLLLQSFTLRLEFTSNDLIVKQLSRELRRFPFKNWISWRIFIKGFPFILYFREKASPHLLPILFDPATLEEQLKKRVGSLEIQQEAKS